MPAIAERNLRSMDLNLLVVFDAILRERSVTRAGHQLGLSQPAMSHALTRLRHMLKDDLFVRSPNGMVPTPRAEQLAEPVRAALDGLQQSLQPIEFNPSKAARTFHIAVDNYAAIVLVAPISLHIGKIAPGIPARELIATFLRAARFASSGAPRALLATCDRHPNRA